MKSLNFPLYHATSSIFEESIKLLGLGGFNPVEKFKAIEFLSVLEEIGNKELADNESWNRFELQYTISLMTHQRITDGGFNYQHGEVYLTPSLYTAHGYSKNKYGSEIISKIFETLDLFNFLEVKIDAKLLDDFEDLLAIKELTAFPVIYEINNLPIEYLNMGESGEEIENQINSVIEDISKYGKVVFGQQLNFRLKKAISIDMLVKMNI
ncbi:MAG: hypothetical protein QM751_08550 [Paludibacteraceae bacterium]